MSVNVNSMSVRSKSEQVFFVFHCTWVRSASNIHAEGVIPPAPRSPTRVMFDIVWDVEYIDIKS